MATKVFISYSHFDSKIAQKLSKSLSEMGVDCFLDRKNIKWGDPITKRVKDGLRACSALIVILSPGSLESQWVPFEVGQATALGKTVLPFLTHPAVRVPLFLRDLNHKSDLKDVRTYFRDVFAVRPASEPGPLKKITPEQRDAIRAERNKVLTEVLKAHDGITDCDVMQLEDHTDKGFLVCVDFDDRQSAAEVLSLIRRTFDECFPDVPIWGEKKTEQDDTVSFAYTYIDEHNKLFQRK
jgi:TIR domain